LTHPRTMDFCHAVTGTVATEGNSSIFYEPFLRSTHACFYCDFLQQRTGSVLSVERDVLWCIWTDHWTVTSSLGMLL